MGASVGVGVGASVEVAKSPTRISIESEVVAFWRHNLRGEGRTEVEYVSCTSDRCF